MGLKEFTLSQQHIDLLRHMIVNWQDCEFGAPEIDPKRPYGNSSVLEDIAEIMGKKMVQLEGGEEGWPKGSFDGLGQLHKETLEALEIMLQLGSLKPGKYKQIEYRHWVESK